MGNQISHLEFIEDIITRMNSNSFMIKGWTITLISALFALAAKDASRPYVLIAYIPLPMFWLLDAFFLGKERQYRALYEHVRVLDEKQIDFSMDTKPFESGNRTWCAAAFSRTIGVFYGFLLLVTLTVMFLIK